MDHLNNFQFYEMKLRGVIWINFHKAAEQSLYGFSRNVDLMNFDGIWPMGATIFDQ